MGAFTNKKPIKAIAEEPETTEEAFGIPEGYKLVPIETKSERLQLLITPSTKKLLQKRAETEGKSVNQICNDAIADYLT